MLLLNERTRTGELQGHLSLNVFLTFRDSYIIVIFVFCVCACVCVRACVRVLEFNNYRVREYTVLLIDPYLNLTYT